MKFTSIDHLKAGYVVSENVYNNDNVVLIKSGTVLSEYSINKLKSLGFTGLYIETELTKDIHIEDLIPQELKNKAIKDLKSLNVSATVRNAKEIVIKVLESKDISLDYMDARSSDNNLFQHSIAVAEYSLIIGKSLGYNEELLIELVTTALLHDIGKLCVDKNLMNKINLTQTKQSTQYIQDMHPVYGYSLLSNSYEISSKSKVGILYHHINEDGTGYPSFDRIPSTIHQFAKIIHVADEYDDKRRISPEEAREYLMAGCGTLFNQEIVQNFVRYVPIYSLGTTVTLSNGIRGIVIEQNKSYPSRPKIILENKEILDLSHEKTYSVTIKSVDDEPEIAKTR